MLSVSQLDRRRCSRFVIYVAFRVAVSFHFFSLSFFQDIDDQHLFSLIRAHQESRAAATAANSSPNHNALARPRDFLDGLGLADLSIRGLDSPSASAFTSASASQFASRSSSSQTLLLAPPAVPPVPAAVCSSLRLDPALIPPVCCNLRSLRIEKQRQLTDASLTAFLQAFPSLRVLWVLRCGAGVSVASLAAIAECACAPELEALTLHRARPFSALVLDAALVRGLTGRCTRLKEIGLTLYQISTEALHELAKLPLLETLTMSPVSSDPFSPLTTASSASNETDNAATSSSTSTSVAASFSSSSALITTSSSPSSSLRSLAHCHPSQQRHHPTASSTSSPRSPPSASPTAGAASVVLSSASSGSPALFPHLKVGQSQVNSHLSCLGPFAISSTSFLFCFLFHLFLIAICSHLSQLFPCLSFFSFACLSLVLILFAFLSFCAGCVGDIVELVCSGFAIPPCCHSKHHRTAAASQLRHANMGTSSIVGDV